MKMIQRDLVTAFALGRSQIHPSVVAAGSLGCSQRLRTSQEWTLLRTAARLKQLARVRFLSLPVQDSTATLVKMSKESQMMSSQPA
jgi:hypothetical protein